MLSCAGGAVPLIYKKKKRKEIVDTMIEPLLEKEILLPGRKIERNGNSFFTFNPSMYEIDPAKVKRISIAKKEG